MTVKNTLSRITTCALENSSGAFSVNFSHALSLLAIAPVCALGFT